MNDCAELPACTRVRYEDLCADPLAGYQALFAATGLPWDDQTGTFIRTSTENSTDSYYGVFRNPLDAAESWKQQLPADAIQRVFAITQGSRAGALYDQ